MKSKSQVPEVSKPELTKNQVELIKTVLEALEPLAAKHGMSEGALFEMAYDSFSQEDSVRLDGEHMERLRGYVEIKGGTVEVHVNEAVSEWLECSASARLEAVQRHSANA